MSYLEIVRSHSNDPEALERAYGQAREAGEAEPFAEAIESVRSEQGDNPLLAAWHFRLAAGTASSQVRAIAWLWAVPLGLLNGLLLWLVSDEQRFMIHITEPVTGRELDLLPAVIMVAAPVSAVVISLFLTAVGARHWQRVLAVGLGLVAAVAYALLLFPQAGPRVFQEQYLMLMVMQLALLAWAGVGMVTFGLRGDAENRFAFLYKSLEAFVVAGLFAIAGGLFTAVTFGLFQALGIEPPEWVIRLFLAGGAGLIAVVAVAVVYDPRLVPARQAFDDGLSKLIALLMRLMLPAALVVLVIYLVFIPFRFREPFENREVLIIYNGMLFAVLALLVGATPVAARDLSRRMQTWLRWGIAVLSVLAVIVSVYALSAILYRTAIDRLTPNRLTFIGWNVINMGILAWLVVAQFRAGRDRWLPALHETFAAGAVVYVAWVIATIMAIPLLFGIDQGEVKDLPTSVQKIVYKEPYPVLLKCGMSPHVYLLDKGEKRWIEDIPTFEDRGFEWHDVRLVDCSALDAIPDGSPIPADAGTPPEPTPGAFKRTAPPTPLPIGYPAPAGGG